jgi:hypothetical protein
MNDQAKKHDPWLDAYEVGKYLCGFDDDVSEEDLEDTLIQKFSINWSDFEKLITRLVPLCHVDVSPLTNTKYCGLADKETGCWLAKREVKQ